MRKPVYTDADALLLLQQGKEPGLDHYFQSYYRSLCYFAYQLTDDAHLAEEIAAEAFVKLWNCREQLGTEGSLKAWLYQTVRNAAIDHLRKVKRLRIGEQGLQTAETVEQSVLHKLVQTETVRQVLRALELLPPKCRLVFQKFYLESKSYAEIGKEMGISVHTAKNQRQRAVRLLKERAGELLLLVAFLCTQLF